MLVQTPMPGPKTPRLPWVLPCQCRPCPRGCSSLVLGVLGAGHCPRLHRVTCAGVLQIRGKPLESDLNQISRGSPDYLSCKQG